MDKNDYYHTGSANKLNRNGWTSWSVSGPPRFKRSTPIFSSAVCEGASITLPGYVQTPTEQNVLPMGSLFCSGHCRDNPPNTWLLFAADLEQMLTDASWELQFIWHSPYERFKVGVNLVWGQELQRQQGLGSWNI